MAGKSTAGIPLPFWRDRAPHWKRRRGKVNI
jgi:hypothetical protein